MIDGIRHLYCPRLNIVSHTAEYGLRYWLRNNNNFLPQSSASNNMLELYCYDGNELLGYLAKDINRLSCAAVESLISIQECKPNKKSLAWQMVKAYYAAFYAAHCTLKICGLGLTQVDQITIQRITRQASAYGYMVPSLNAGLYCIELDEYTTQMRLYSVLRYDDNHRGLWKRYYEFIGLLCGTHIQTGSTDSNCVRVKEPSEKSTLSVYEQLPVSDAEIIVERLEMLKTCLNRRGDMNWLSYIRNEVNYNHAFGVWYPYGSYKESFADILRNNMLFIKSPLCEEFNVENNSDVLAFYKCCQLIVSICMEIINDLAYRHPKNKSFLNYGVLRLLKYTQTS